MLARFQIVAAISWIFIVANSFQTNAPVSKPQIAITDLFRPGDALPSGEQYTCYRIPVLLEASGVLLAFAEGRRYVGDHCYPRHPVPGSAPAKVNGTSGIVLRRSTDGGATWSPMITVANIGDDFQAVADLQGNSTPVLHVQYTPDCNVVQPNCNRLRANQTRLVQATSLDLGLTWAPPVPIADRNGRPVLGQWDGLLVGPGAALQLRASNPHHPYRLLWCGHRDGRVSPIWSSDDGGHQHQLNAVLPMDVTPGPIPQYGPSECLFVELPNGTVRYDARNNFPRPTHHQARVYSLSGDGGDTWGQP